MQAWLRLKLAKLPAAMALLEEEGGACQLGNLETHRQLRESDRGEVEPVVGSKKRVAPFCSQAEEGLCEMDGVASMLKAAVDGGVGNVGGEGHTQGIELHEVELEAPIDLLLAQVLVVDA